MADVPFGIRLRELREQAGLTIYKLSQLSRVSKQGIAKIESGDSVPNWLTVVKLARALGVPVGEFDVQV